jgi:hypothetical protein
VKATPQKPVITLDSDGITLVSSANTGNQWYREGVDIPGAKEQRYRPVTSGSYAVRSTSDSCAGPLSDAFSFIVTSLLDLGNGRFIKLYPNPLPNQKILSIDWSLGPLVRQLQVIARDNNGREISRHLLDKKNSALKMNVSAGIYHLEFRWNEGGRNEFRIMSLWVVK